MNNLGLLWQKQVEYLDALNNAQNCIEDLNDISQLTIRDVLDNGFNNANLETCDTTIELGYKDKIDGYSEQYSEDVLDLKVKLIDFDTDDDGYDIVRIELADKRNESKNIKLIEESFKEVK